MKASYGEEKWGKLEQEYRRHFYKMTAVGRFCAQYPC